MNKLFVFLPCYNEELNIGALIDEWMNESAKLEEEGYHLIVCPIDDKSTDNTQAKMREKAALYGEDRINIIAHEQNKNLRGGLNTSVENFLKLGGDDDLMCLMDGDDTHSGKKLCLYDGAAL